MEKCMMVVAIYMQRGGDGARSWVIGSYFNARLLPKLPDTGKRGAEGEIRYGQL
jgi:hypothetical protein